MQKRLILFLSLAAMVTILGAEVTAQQAPNQVRMPPEQQGDPLAEFRHPKNLKVLPKKISPEELQATMRTFSKSLGVRCGFCHVTKKVETGEHPELDFVSDAKDEKRNARKMVLMTADINKKYLGKIDKNFEVACVSCHRGNVKPMTSVDSLSRQVRSVAVPAPPPFPGQAPIPPTPPPPPPTDPK